MAAASDSESDFGWGSAVSEQGLRTPVPLSDLEDGYRSLSPLPAPEDDAISPASGSAVAIDSPAPGQSANDGPASDVGYESVDEAPRRRGRGRPLAARQIARPRAVQAEEVGIVELVQTVDVPMWSRSESRCVLLEGILALPASARTTSSLVVDALGIVDPPPFGDTEHGKTCEHLLRSHLEAATPSRGTTWAQEMLAAGLAPGQNLRGFQSRYYGLAELVCGGSRLFLSGLARKIEQQLRSIPSRWEGVLLATYSQSDEASSRLRVPYTRPALCSLANSAHGAGGTAVAVEIADTVTEVAKVVQSSVLVGMLLRCVQSGRYLYIRTGLPTWLLAVDRATGEALQAVHRLLISATSLSIPITRHRSVDTLGGSWRILATFG
jgi:hypothetical protein